jgi:hypothetical protein
MLDWASGRHPILHQFPLPADNGQRCWEAAPPCAAAKQQQIGAAKGHGADYLVGQKITPLAKGHTPRLKWLWATACQVTRSGFKTSDRVREQGAGR